MSTEALRKHASWLGLFMSLCLNLRIRLLESSFQMLFCFLIFFSFFFNFVLVLCFQKGDGSIIHTAAMCLCMALIFLKGNQNFHMWLSEAPLLTLVVTSHGVSFSICHWHILYFIVFLIQFQDHLACCNDSQLLICWLVHYTQSNTILSCSWSPLSILLWGHIYLYDSFLFCLL